MKEVKIEVECPDAQAAAKAAQRACGTRLRDRAGRAWRVTVVSLVGWAFWTAVLLLLVTWRG